MCFKSICHRWVTDTSFQWNAIGSHLDWILEFRELKFRIEIFNVKKLQNLTSLAYSRCNNEDTNVPLLFTKNMFHDSSKIFRNLSKFPLPCEPSAIKKQKKIPKMADRILFFLGMRKNEFKSENGDEDLLTSQPLVPTKYMHSNKYWIYNCYYS